MRLPKLDLRLRIAIALATLCIVVVGALGVALHAASHEMEQALVQQLVKEELDFLVDRASRVDGYVPAGGPNLEYYVVGTPAERDRMSPELRELPSGHHEILTHEGARHVGVREASGTRYIVSYDTGPHEEQAARFRRLLYMGLAAVAFVAIALGYWVSAMLTRQLNELAVRVAQFRPDEPHPRLEQPHHAREVAALARALDAYHERILDVLRREQEFTANASHELRTPLTAIQTTCELIQTDAALAEKTRTRITMIESATRQMTERIEALLLLARQRKPEEIERVDLRRCVEEAAHACRDEIAQKGLVFEVAIEHGAVVELDRRALQLVLANLIKNAVRYTHRGIIRISYEAPRVIVADSGVGIAPEHAPQLFERYFRGDDTPDGLGLGLAIVRRICDDLGWKVEVQSRPGVGSTFSIVLA
jgi:signal transduction histidine kinase